MVKSYILIVDDDQEVAMMLASYLQALGYESDYVLDGTQAAAKMQGRKPDLILMDFRMPGGSGHQVYEKLQALPQAKGIPVIFVSAISPEEARKTIPHSPRVRFIKKPVDVKLLQQLIRDLLSNKAAPSQPP